MAARASLHNEERNLQRIREQERRIQEVQQEQERYLESVPLFGEPYKTNKGDELSSRIQRMLGSYEDVPEPVSLYASAPTGHPTYRESRPVVNSPRFSTKVSSPAFSPSVDESGPPLPALSPPPAHPLSPLHSSGSESGETDGYASPEHRPYPLTSSQSSQPQPLPSKPLPIMPQKPTAYVRPMDGQDQAPAHSPQLKPSTEDIHGPSYEKSNAQPRLPKLKIPTIPSETFSNEAHCVEEILREMTHSWPPPLTAIHTPNTSEPPKFTLPAKESQQADLTGQKQQSSPSAKAASSRSQQAPVVPQCGGRSVHSSGGESASSSDAESSSGSESESESNESTRDEPPSQQNVRLSPTPQSDAPNKWQLDNWLIKVNQQSVDTVCDPGLSPCSPSQAPQQKRLTLEQEYKSQSPPPPHQPPSPPPPAAAHRKTVANKRPSHAHKSFCPEEGQVGLKVESVEVLQPPVLQPFPERPKKERKSVRKSNKACSSKRSSKHVSSDKKTRKEVVGQEEGEKDHARIPAVSSALQVPPLKLSRKGEWRRKEEHVSQQALVVKIHLGLLSRIPQAGSRPLAHTKQPKATNRQQASEGPSKACKKRQADVDEKVQPKKKLKLDKEVKVPASDQSLSKYKPPESTEHEKDKRRVKKSQQHRPVSAAESQKAPGYTLKDRDAVPTQPCCVSTSKHGKSGEKGPELDRRSKKASKPSSAPLVPTLPSRESLPSRPLLKFDIRQRSVDYHMKEAKKLKHKADATSDKLGKAFNYLDAAMSFVESGVAMETDPQTPKSAYTMFSETLDLIRFILKLKGSVNPPASVSDKDFTVLCLRCQSLLQMAMFRHKREAALKYSRTLTEHFKNSRSTKPGSPSLSRNTGMPSCTSPIASTHTSGPPPSNSTVVIPHVIQQVASSYVNITSLFLSAHDTWDQADVLAHTGSGLLSELNSALGPLSLTSSMTLLVHHTRQGLHWLRLEANANVL